MSNEIKNKIEKLQNSLMKKRGTGRTEKMLDRVIAQTLDLENQKIIVFALTNDIANYVANRFIEKLPTFVKITFIPGKAVEVDGNIIMFKTESYENTTGYKYQEWDGEYSDNSISDSYVIKHIQFLENEISEPESRRNRSSFLG